MRAKWTFGLVVLLVPSLLDASAALARLRVQPALLAGSVLRLQVVNRFVQPVRWGCTGPHDFKQSESWSKVSSAKKEVYELIIQRSDAVRKARRELLHQTEFYTTVFDSWVPKELRSKLLSEDPNERRQAKAALGYHFMVLQARAEKPPK